MKYKWWEIYFNNLNLLMWLRQTSSSFYVVKDKGVTWGKLSESILINQLSAFGLSCESHLNMKETESMQTYLGKSIIHSLQINRTIPKDFVA